jgi:hypothetical protein
MGVAFGVSLNETFIRNLTFIVSHCSGLVKGNFMQAYAVQDQLKGLPRLSVFSNFLVEIMTKRKE